jgi:phosphatidylinositol kinase/protein kinase (PI-3  family)
MIQLILCLLFSLSVFSKNNACPVGTDLIYPSKAKFQIKSYDSASKTFKIFSPEFPGEGDSDIALEKFLELAKISNLEKQTIKKNPEEIIDGVYESTKDLPTLYEEEKEKRKRCGK